MSRGSATAGPGTAAAGTTPMRRVATASLIGTTIEFYDFYVYGIAASLVFGRIFFPALGTVAATTAAFATLGVAFVARPLGAVLFGHLGDRLGRKRTLVATLLLMGIATALVGVLPTSTQIGAAAPIVLVVLRLVQGLAAGGEWAGAVLFSAEYSPSRNRGFWGMFASFGGGLGLLLANVTFLVTLLTMSEETFLSIGWRIPFLISVVLIAIGLYIRLRIDETPSFRAQAARGGVSRMPFTDVLRTQPRQVLIGSGLVVMAFAFSYLSSSFLVSYGSTRLGLGYGYVLAGGVVGGVVASVTIALSGLLSDRFGRRRMIVLANVAGVPWALLLFPLIDQGSMAAFLVGIIVSMTIAGTALGPLGATVSELFHTRYRYTAAGLCYNIASIIGGGITPLLATTLTASFGTVALGLLLLGLAILSLVCSLFLRETRHVSLDEESTPDSVDAASTVR